MYLVPDAHALKYLVANGATMNLVAFVTDSNLWLGVEGKFTASTTKTEAVEAFATSGLTVWTIPLLQLGSWTSGPFLTGTII